jgi:hypothetical protein
MDCSQLTLAAIEANKECGNYAYHSRLARVNCFGRLLLVLPPFHPKLHNRVLLRLFKTGFGE